MAELKTIVEGSKAWGREGPRPENENAMSRVTKRSMVRPVVSSGARDYSHLLSSDISFVARDFHSKEVAPNMVSWATRHGAYSLRSLEAAKKCVERFGLKVFEVAISESESMQLPIHYTFQKTPSELVIGSTEKKMNVMHALISSFDWTQYERPEPYFFGALDWLNQEDPTLVNRKGVAGLLPVHIGAAANCLATLEWMYNRDKDMLLEKDDYDHTPLDIAKGVGAKEAIDYLDSLDLA